ncbi:hypothetical protein SAMN05443248_3928 [Bradyrhizobium erythrophlei]|uniref:Uncharacterized protein n=1 Tax=Bradyrhizobium erythrophlei TaxID=1437360 RepID=A0A1M5QSR5_9BRAD|nr:hypothetical protein SAMN05443248_3928 [Bradyrhizobium erythrophlei]
MSSEKTSYRGHARAVLSTAGITIGQDLASLTGNQLGAIRSEAAAAYVAKHGKAMPADSAAYISKRYDLLQQRASQRGRA